jgi:hypothetical protein
LATAWSNIASFKAAASTGTVPSDNSKRGPDIGRGSEYF